MIEFTHDELLFMSYFKTFPKSKLVRALMRELRSLDHGERRKRDMIESILDKLEYMSEDDLDRIDPDFEEYELDDELLPSWRASEDDDDEAALGGLQIFLQEDYLMQTITFEEQQLLSLYNTGDRAGTISAIRDMRGYLESDETELKELTDSVLEKLVEMSDADFEALDLMPDFAES